MARVGEGVPSRRGGPEWARAHEAGGRAPRLARHTAPRLQAPHPLLTRPQPYARSHAHSPPRHRTRPMRTRRAPRSSNLSSGWSRTSTRATCAGASASAGSCREPAHGAGPWCRALVESRAVVESRGGEQGRGGRAARIGPPGGSLGHALALKAASEEPTRQSPCRLALDAGTAPRSRRGPARWRCSTRRTARGGVCCSSWSTAARASSPAA